MTTAKPNSFPTVVTASTPRRLTRRSQGYDHPAGRSRDVRHRRRSPSPGANRSRPVQQAHAPCRYRRRPRPGHRGEDRRAGAHVPRGLRPLSGQAPVAVGNGGRRVACLHPPHRRLRRVLRPGRRSVYPPPAERPQQGGRGTADDRGYDRRDARRRAAGGPRPVGPQGRVLAVLPGLRRRPEGSLTSGTSSSGNPSRRAAWRRSRN